MATDRQIEANRNNAQHSTGPRTTEGKQRSAQNAVTHGLSSKHCIIPGEDPADYDELLLAYCNVFGPSDPYKHTLIRQMADAEWRLRRSFQHAFKLLLEFQELEDRVLRRTNDGRRRESAA